MIWYPFFKKKTIYYLLIIYAHIEEGKRHYKLRKGQVNELPSSNQQSTLFEGKAIKQTQNNETIIK